MSYTGFHHLADTASQTHWPVISCTFLVTFLEYWCNMCHFPFHWYHIFIQTTEIVVKVERISDIHHSLAQCMKCYRDPEINDHLFSIKLQLSCKAKKLWTLVHLLFLVQQKVLLHHLQQCTHLHKIGSALVHTFYHIM